MLICTNFNRILKSNFKNPPADARPMVRWWWFGTAVEKPEILRELQQMKADGIGGAELAFVYPQVLDDPAKNLINEPFVGPDMLDNVRYAQTEGRKLGLRIDVTLGSGWPYGGPATTLAEAAGRLRTAEVPVPANATSPSLFPNSTRANAIISASITARRTETLDCRICPAPCPYKFRAMQPSWSLRTLRPTPRRPLLHRQPHQASSQARRRRSRRLGPRSLLATKP